MTTSDLYARLTAEHFALGQVPSFAVVARRIRGRGLQREPLLVDFIVELCAPANELKTIRRTVNRLLEGAAPGRGTPVPIPAATADNGLPAEMEALRVELRQAMDELRQMKEQLRTEPAGNTRTDAADAQQRLLVQWLLATARPAPAGGPEPREDRVQTEQTERPDARPDSDVEALMSALRVQDPSGARFGAVLRRSLDLLYDGARTGRFRWAQLSRHEKTFLGVLVRQETAREFGLSDGDSLEFRLGDVEFNLAFSTTIGQWTVPQDGRDAVYLLIAGNEDSATVSASVVRATPDFLSRPNGDQKSAFNSAGRAAMRWLCRQAPLPVNLLAGLSEEDADAIFSPRTGHHRIVELFRRVREQPIDRTTVETVAMERDATKRVRDARGALRRRGILVLGGIHSQTYAKDLGLVLNPDEWMSVQVTPFAGHDPEAPGFSLDGTRWVIARPGDAVVDAPILPVRR
jgi:hypothetical protein